MKNIHIEVFLNDPEQISNIICKTIPDILSNLARKLTNLDVTITTHADIPKRKGVIVAGPDAEAVADELEKRNQPCTIMNEKHKITDNMKRIEEFVLNPI